MAEKAGDAALAANPHWLIFVEGIDHYQGQYYWWGGDLAAAKRYPVKLSEPGHLVYEAHDYGPDVYNHSWFGAKNFPPNLPGVWESNWAYLKDQNMVPVLLGEFGGRSVGNDTRARGREHSSRSSSGTASATPTGAGTPTPATPAGSSMTTGRPSSEPNWTSCVPISSRCRRRSGTDREATGIYHSRTDACETGEPAVTAGAAPGNGSRSTRSTSTSAA
jgi:hypothetical protein